MRSLLREYAGNIKDCKDLNRVICRFKKASIIPEGTPTFAIKIRPSPYAPIRPSPMLDTQRCNISCRTVLSTPVRARIDNTCIVIDLFEPQYVLAVNWTNTTSAQLGNSIPPSKLQDPFHTIQLLSRSDDQPPDDDPDIPANLVLVLTDPDALSRDKPVWSEVCHSILYAHAPYGDARPKQIIEYLPPVSP